MANGMVWFQGIWSNGGGIRKREIQSATFGGAIYRRVQRVTLRFSDGLNLAGLEAENE